MCLIDLLLTPVNSLFPLLVLVIPDPPDLVPLRLVFLAGSLPSRSLNQLPPTQVPLMLHPPTRRRHS